MLFVERGRASDRFAAGQACAMAGERLSRSFAEECEQIFAQATRPAADG